MLAKGLALMLAKGLGGSSGLTLPLGGSSGRVVECGLRWARAESLCCGVRVEVGQGWVSVLWSAG